MEFLELDIHQWDNHDSYKASAQIIDNINVVNDSAERAVKVTSDFAPAARTEGHYQHVLQVVSAERKAQPNLRSRKKTKQ